MFITLHIEYLCIEKGERKRDFTLHIYICKQSEKCFLEKERIFLYSERIHFYIQYRFISVYYIYILIYTLVI